MHLFIVTIIKRLNQNKFFKLTSSIRLAVPVMLGLIVAIAVGTVLESNHNAEYAKIALYDAWWFNTLLSLLALNVFCSMMSRYPWKKYQIGFVMTHVGILILLGGSWLTKIYGIDGSLQVQEGESQNVVVLPRLMLGYQFEGSAALNSSVFSKTLYDQDEDDLSAINQALGHMIRAKNFIPFAEIEKGYSSAQEPGKGAVGSSFGLKSAFFDVKEWLHSEENPEMQMGPAHLKLVVEDVASLIEKPSGKSSKSSSSLDGDIVTIQGPQGKPKDFTFSQLKKGVDFNGVQVRLEKVYDRAMVAENKILENQDPASPLNKAAELSLEKNGKKIREVLYAKYPGFSISKEGTFDLKLSLLSSAGEIKSALPAGHPVIDPGEVTTEAPSMPGGNLIEFRVARDQPDRVRIVLKKKGEVVLEKVMKEGDTFTTPWMGMQLFVGSISFGSKSQVQVKSIRPLPGKNLPPSAIFLEPVGSAEGFWLPQGEVKQVNLGGRPATVVFANETLTLPFQLRLEQFSKKDYPGTETPYSYESLVTNFKDQKKTLISMNEPLKEEGYTLYQASFSLVPGQKPVSILSVNRDPGRPIKYLGSAILILGIITFTLMRSRLNRKYPQGAAV